jgi:hypothetical protein
MFVRSGLIGFAVVDGAVAVCFWWSSNIPSVVYF